MCTEHENARNHWYVFRFNGESLSELITYRNNLINRVQADAQMRNAIPAEIAAEWRQFPAQGVTDERFNRFVRLAERANYQIFQVFRL